MISGMKKDILVAGFLLSIIDRFTGGILVVCVNSFLVENKVVLWLKRKGEA